jgi:hypothetical protein
MMTTVANKEATDKRAVEEAMMKRATEEAAVKAAANEEATTKRAAEEAMVKRAAVKVAADEEVADKTADEAVGAVGDSPAPGQAPSVARTKRAAAPSGSTLLVKCPYRGVWKPRFVQLSLLSFFFARLHSLITSPLCLAPLPSMQPPRWARLLLPQAPLPQMRLSG